MTAPSRNSAYYQDFLAKVEEANPHGQIVIVTDDLSSHGSKSTRAWPADHPRIRQVFIPIGACRLNLVEGWWRLFRKTALAGQDLADTGEIDQVTQAATAHLNTRARPWRWGRPQPKPRAPSDGSCALFEERSTGRRLATSTRQPPVPGGNGCICATEAASRTSSTLRSATRSRHRGARLTRSSGRCRGRGCAWRGDVIETLGDQVADMPHRHKPEVSAGNSQLPAMAEQVGDRIAVLPVLFHLLWSGPLAADLGTVPLSAITTVTIAGGPE